VEPRNRHVSLAFSLRTSRYHSRTVDFVLVVSKCYVAVMAPRFVALTFIVAVTVAVNGCDDSCREPLARDAASAGAFRAAYSCAADRSIVNFQRT
jgi:hypothetical protein